MFETMADMLQERLLEYQKHPLKYCGLDTLAMVKVWEKLKEVTDKK